MKTSILLILLLLFGHVTLAEVKVYHADLFDSQWKFEKKPLSCELSHTIPDYGRARFFFNAGESVHFDLTVSNKALRKGSAFLSSIPPEWKHRLRPVDIGRITVVAGNTPIVLEQEDSMNILSELELGMMPEIEYRDWYNNQYRIKVILSPVNFMAQLPAFQQCMLALQHDFPLGFNDLRFANVFFNLDKVEVNPEFRELLISMAKFAAKDPELKQVVIIGYADPTGDACYNKDISHFRAENVMDILTEYGVPEDKIMVIGKGAIKSTEPPTPDGFSFDRRVTVELIRKGELLPVLEEPEESVSPARPSNSFFDDEEDF